MEYRFYTSTYNVDALLPEVSQALEQRMETYSRQQLPGVWKQIDRVPGSGAPHTTTPGRRVYRRVTSILLIAVGLFLLIPGLVRPDELLGPLVAGALAVGAGIYFLWSTRKNRTTRFQKEARAFLAQVAQSEPTEVSFTGEGMQLGDRPLIPYSQIQYHFQTPSGHFITWENQAVFLQQKDLTDGDAEEFASFLRAQLS